MLVHDNLNTTFLSTFELFDLNDCQLGFFKIIMAHLFL